MSKEAIVTIESPFVGADPVEEDEIDESLMYADPESDGAEDEPASEDTSEEEVEETETPEKKEDEPEPEPEASDESDVEQEQEGINIPKSRLDREIKRRRALEEQLKELQQQLQTPQRTNQNTSEPAPELNIGEDAKAMFDKIIDGDLDDATGMFNKIINSVVSNTTQNLLDKVNSDLGQQIDSRNKQLAQSTAVQGVIDGLMNKYEAFDHNSESFDSDLTQRALIYQKAYIEQGYQPADALELGADDAMRLLRPELVKGETPIQKPPVTKPAQVKKKVDIARKQPNKLSGESTASENKTVDIFNMSDEDFEQLSDAELKKLRGDLV